MSQGNGVFFFVFCFVVPSVFKLVLFCRDKNCTAIWEAFKVVLDKDPCSVLPSDYDLFINLSRHSIPRDKVTLPAPRVNVAPSL